jgi:cobyrinic acid a,c-diamide synthase
MSGFLIAAPQSGSGKTVLTLALLRALKDAGIAVAPAKAGPDYIDPAFHAAAAGTSSVNLDPWAMRPNLIADLAHRATSGNRMLVVEGMMGLFDGAADGTGSTADLAALLGLPVILVVDARKLGHSVAALVSGFAGHRMDVSIAGIILNRTGSDRHEAMLRGALAPIGIPVLGAVRRGEALAVPERHLGLVQAGEHEGLEAFIENAAKVVAAAIDLDALAAIAAQASPIISGGKPARLKPLGQRMAVARDTAFAFSYPHLVEGWREQGAELSFFSPMSGEGPAKDADAIYLPGGYPELHAGAIAGNETFRAAMTEHAARGTAIHGECGGYMVLGEALTDASGATHPMLGLLPLETSFAARTLHLGYRQLIPINGAPFSGPVTAHEFHYATVVREGQADRLFTATDALGADLGGAGLQRGNVSGSFMHVIDRADA